MGSENNERRLLFVFQTCLKRNFPMTVCTSVVGRSVGSSVCHNFLRGLGNFTFMLLSGDLFHRVRAHLNYLYNRPHLSHPFVRLMPVFCHNYKVQIINSRYLKLFHSSHEWPIRWKWYNLKVICWNSIFLQQQKIRRHTYFQISYTLFFYNKVGSQAKPLEQRQPRTLVLFTRSW